MLPLAVFSNGRFTGTNVETFVVYAALGGFFFLFGSIFAGSLGMGDAKLGFLIGLALGTQTFGAALLAFAGLLVAALYVLATRGVSARPVDTRRARRQRG